MLSIQRLFVKLIQSGTIFPETALRVGADNIEIRLVGYLFDFLNIFQRHAGIDVNPAFLGGAEHGVVKRLRFTAVAVGMIIQRKLVFPRNLNA